MSDVITGALIALAGVAAAPILNLVTDYLRRNWNKKDEKETMIDEFSKDLGYFLARYGYQLKTLHVSNWQQQNGVRLLRLRRNINEGQYGEIERIESEIEFGHALFDARDALKAKLYLLRRHINNDVYVYLKVSIEKVTQVSAESINRYYDLLLYLLDSDFD